MDATDTRKLWNDACSEVNMRHDLICLWAFWGKSRLLLLSLQSFGIQEKRIPRDAATFAALLDACVRNNDKKLALKTYQRAMDAGFIDNAVIYTTAMAACIPDKDKETALQIFQQSRRYVLIVCPIECISFFIDCRLIVIMHMEIHSRHFLKIHKGIQVRRISCHKNVFHQNDQHSYQRLVLW